MTSWRALLHEELKVRNDKLIFNTLSDEQMDREFDGGFGSGEDTAFTAWSNERVYFPACYDGAVWVDSVPRNPCNEKTEHVGG